MRRRAADPDGRTSRFYRPHFVGSRTLTGIKSIGDPRRAPPCVDLSVVNPSLARRRSARIFIFADMATFKLHQDLKASAARHEASHPGLWPWCPQKFGCLIGRGDLQLPCGDGALQRFNASALARPSKHGALRSACSDGRHRARQRRGSKVTLRYRGAAACTVAGKAQ